MWALITLETEVNELPIPAWGLHLVDVNVALGNLVDLVRTQSGG